MPRWATPNSGELFGEDDRLNGLKSAAAYRNGLTPVLCIGERQQGPLEEDLARCAAEMDAALNRAQSIGPADHRGLRSAVGYRD